MMSNGEKGLKDGQKQSEKIIIGRLLKFNVRLFHLEIIEPEYFF